MNEVLMILLGLITMVAIAICLALSKTVKALQKSLDSIGKQMTALEKKVGEQHAEISRMQTSLAPRAGNTNLLLPVIMDTILGHAKRGPWPTAALVGMRVAQHFVTTRRNRKRNVE